MYVGRKKESEEWSWPAMGSEEEEGFSFLILNVNQYLRNCMRFVRPNSFSVDGGGGQKRHRPSRRLSLPPNSIQSIRKPAGPTICALTLLFKGESLDCADTLRLLYISLAFARGFARETSILSWPALSNLYLILPYDYLWCKQPNYETS